MADTITATGTYGTYYYIDSSSSKDVLTWSQMQANAKYFYSWCSSEQPTWTLNAISAILGNIQSEGAMNPSQWEYGYNKSLTHGYGLVQWTPATKFLDWASENHLDNQSIDAQAERLEYERANGLQYYKTGTYNYSFTEFLTGNRSVAELAAAWLYNYERPKNPAATKALRVKQAETWYKFLSGEEPDPPKPPTPPPRPPEKQAKRMPIWMYPQHNINRRL